MKFYIPNRIYLDYLREVESKVMSINKNYNNKKFVLGTILEIDEISYYVPVSSIKEKHLDKNGLISRYKKTCIGIKEKETFLSILRFDYMFPIPLEELEELKIEKLEEPYKDLVNKEYFFCKKNRREIEEKAMMVYIKAKKPTHYLNGVCCNFSLLEVQYNKWIKNKKAEK